MHSINENDQKKTSFHVEVINEMEELRDNYTGSGS